nr:hypothetical protein [Tanacetum cinerariifolium]
LSNGGDMWLELWHTYTVIRPLTLFVTFANAWFS